MRIAISSLVIMWGYVTQRCKIINCSKRPLPKMCFAIKGMGNMTGVIRSIIPPPYHYGDVRQVVFSIPTHLHHGSKGP